jgi:F-type H+-transporting ATPase subunit b
VHPLLMAEASPGQTFIVQCLGFAVLAFVLVKLVFPVLGKILAGRTLGIEETFKKIDQDTHDATKRMAEIKEKLGQLTQESQRRLQAAMDDAQKTKSQLLTDANAQVQGAVEKARREIQIEREKAVLELREEATGLTLRAAEQLVQSTMNEDINRKIVDTYLGQLDSVKRT